MTELRIRRGVRALLVTPDADLLMVRFEFPTRTVWAVPGGGLDPGEDHLTALRRELVEELGFHAAAIGEHVWVREHIFSFPNGLWDGQRERFHLVPVADRFEPRPALSWEQLNEEYVFEIRWWTLAELEAASDVEFAPRRLPELLRSLVESGTPDRPIDTGV